MWCAYSVLFVLLCFNAIAEYTPPRTANGKLPEQGALGNGTLLEPGVGYATLFDGFCTFYVKPPASVPIVVYDLIFTSTLVYWFVKPLNEARKNSMFADKLAKMTQRSLTGARVTLLASFLNFMGLVLFAMVRCSVFACLSAIDACSCALFCTAVR